MEGLTQDIMVEILSRLPVKSLLRCRCVCKQWLSLITDPKFAKLHLTRAISKENYLENRRLLISIYTGDRTAVSPGMICTDYKFNISIYTTVNDKACVHTGFDLISRQVVGSCNGLLCVVYGYSTFYLWNPSTREQKTLPCPGAVRVRSFFRVHLLYGFGYDSSSDDYKLFWGSYNGSKLTMEVFSLKTNSWRRNIHKNFPIYYPSQSSGIFVNTTLHWAVDKVHEGAGVDLSNRVISFDLKDEKFMEVPLPDETRSGCCPTLGVLRGDLSMIQHNFDDSHQVWMMKEYRVKDSWTKLIRLPPSPITDMVPFDYTKDGDIVVLVKKRKLAIYNSRTETLENIMPVVPQSDYWYQMALYVETLISPNNYS